MAYGRIIGLLVLLVILAGCGRRSGTVVAPVPPAPAKRPPVVTLAAVGDVSLVGYPRQTKQGVVSPFAQVAGVLQGADIAFCNLECALSERGEPAEKEFVFRAAPESAEMLREAGVDLVTLANNHSVDFGREALADTLAALAAQQVSWVGAGENLESAQEIRTFTFGEDDRTRTRVALLAFSNMLPIEFYATARLAGTTPALETLIKEGVAAARAQADFVVVSFHWGEELAQVPRTNERILGHLAVDAGADVVLGCHPHVLQGIECYKDGLIVYSLGNFVFYSRGLSQESAVFRVKLQKPKDVSLEIVPVRIEGGVPRPAKYEEAKLILARLHKLSGELGTQLDIRGERAFVTAKP